MGCGQSKIENEEAVARCKDRKQFMKEAVSFRNAFAAAHSAYAMSLKNTGAALSDFAHGEVINPNLLHTTTTTTTTTIHQSLPATSAAAAAVAAAQPPPPPDIYPPPPPPISSPFTPAPLHRAVSMPEMIIPKKPENLVGPTIIEEENDDEMEIENNSKLVMKKRSYRKEVENDPSPPPPPSVVMTSASPPQAAMQGANDSRWAEFSDYIFQPQESMMGPGLTPVEEEVKEHKVFDERPKRVEDVEEVVTKSAKVVAVEPPEKVAVAAAAAVVVVDTPVVVGGGTGGSVGKSVKKGKGGGERRVVKGSVNLLQIFLELDDHFLKASESAHEVSKMLEAARLHYHSNFADNRGNDLRLSDECCYVGRI